MTYVAPVPTWHHPRWALGLLISSVTHSMGGLAVGYRPGWHMEGRSSRCKTKAVLAPGVRVGRGVGGAVRGGRTGGRDLVFWVLNAGLVQCMACR